MSVAQCLVSQCYLSGGALTSIIINHVTLGKGSEVCLENPSNCMNYDPLTCSLGL